MSPLLLHVFPTLAVGGQQTRFATLANRFGDRYRHVLVSLDGGDGALGLLGAGVDFRVLKVARASPPRRLVNIARHLGSVRPDALVTYNWGSIEWAAVNRARFGLPHVHLEDGFGADEADRQRAGRVWTRALVLRRSFVVVPSHGLAALAVARWRLPADRVRYIPNGIDAARFDSPPEDGRYFARDGACVIGSFSPLRPEKNLARLLRAVAQLPGLRLVLCGDGPDAAALRALAAELGIAERVVFTGHVAAPELVIGAFDVFAMTSDTEQMPYAVLEAMCAALPVVATDVGDIAAMVDASNQPFIVPRDEPARLVEALRMLADDAGLRRQVGAANRRRVMEEYTIERMAAAFGAVLDQALR